MNYLRLIQASCFVMAFASVSASELKVLSMEISGYTLSAKIAHTPLSRSQGLMYRESLEENTGMLFIFTHADHYGMWMHNTYIPLSVAFIDEEGVILNIADMIPYTRTVHSSAGMAKYALEMNKGWFSERKIVVGARVLGLEQAPTAN